DGQRPRGDSGEEQDEEDDGSTRRGSGGCSATRFSPADSTRAWGENRQAARKPKAASWRPGPRENGQGEVRRLGEGDGRADAYRRRAAGEAGRVAERIQTLHRGGPGLRLFPRLRLPPEWSTQGNELGPRGVPAASGRHAPRPWACSAA